MFRKIRLSVMKTRLDLAEKRLDALHKRVRTPQSLHYYHKRLRKFAESVEKYDALKLKGKMCYVIDYTKSES